VERPLYFVLALHDLAQAIAVFKADSVKVCSAFVFLVVIPAGNLRFRLHSIRRTGVHHLRDGIIVAKVGRSATNFCRFPPPQSVISSIDALGSQFRGKVAQLRDHDQIFSAA
jgi:hypothetical protein